MALYSKRSIPVLSGVLTILRRKGCPECNPKHITLLRMFCYTEWL